MNSQQLKKIILPDKPGVYFFYAGKNILYVGKATSLRSRVKSYFVKELVNTRGPLILDMVTLATSIKWQETDSVLEALILEVNLIKKYQPKYNTKEKDNKSFNYVCITKNPSRPPLNRGGGNAGGPSNKEDLGIYKTLPKVLVIRGRGLNKKLYDKVYGPFPNGGQLKEALRIIRKIFPFIDEQSSKKNNKEFYEQLGLVPSINSSHPPLERAGVNANHSQFIEGINEYKKNIKNIKLFFEGKKKSIITNLKKEMFMYAKKREFEKAGIVKKKIFALAHINDISLIKNELSQGNAFEKVLGRGGREPAPDHFQKHFPAPLYRIEAYDIAHLSGKDMVGVMTVIENKELLKSEYRKFIIRTKDKANDTGALEEVLSRRLRHSEWGLPDLIVMDGAQAQRNIAQSVLARFQFKIPVVSVVKDDKHKPKAIIGDELIIKNYKKEILLINHEAHRFAITFHKKRRDKNFLAF
jgi:excinuclease ABC subunit C